MKSSSDSICGRYVVRLLSASVLAVTWIVWLVIVLYTARMVSAYAYDFNVYYVAAEALRFHHQANIYSVATLTRVAHAHGACPSLSIPGYIYPPLLAATLEPLTLLPCTSASAVWALLNAALWAAATILLAQVVARRWPRRHRLHAFMLVSLLSLGCWQAFDGLFLGQIHLVLFFGFALALWLLDHQHPWVAGAVLGALTVVKVLPIVLVGYYLLRQRFRVVGGAALAGVALLVVMLAASSPATVGESLPAVFASMPTLVTPGQNEALIVALPDHVGLLLAALIGVMFVVVTVRSRWWRGRGGQKNGLSEGASDGARARVSGDDLLGVGFALCTMLLISPLVWSFYLVWLVPSLCACLVGIVALASPDSQRSSGLSETPSAALRHHGNTGRAHGVHGVHGVRWAPLTLGVGLLMTIIVILAAPSTPLAPSAHPFATLALWALLGVLLWRSCVYYGVEAPISLNARVMTADSGHPAPYLCT